MYKTYISITTKITGLTFLLVLATIAILCYIGHSQITTLFHEYLRVKGAALANASIDFSTINGPEQDFLDGFRESFRMAAIAVSLVAIIAGYALARTITDPLCKLSKATERIAKGHLYQNVNVETNDEVGCLADSFNRMSKSLAKNDKVNKQLQANISHELKTPLAIIQGNLEGMLDGIIEPSDDQLRSLHEEAVHLNHLIKELHDLSLAEVYQLHLQKVSCNINQIIGRSLRVLKPLSDKKSIDLHADFAKNIPSLELDIERIHQVFYNILLNGIRYSPIGSQVQVKTQRRTIAGQRWVCISIKDNGPGINPEDLPHIFDHFYRGEKSRDRKSGGSGLGLAVAKHMAENHGGDIYVTSTLGVGTTFEVLLPLETINTTT
jgi:two-component system sensor histidine kinase BaeS